MLDKLERLSEDSLLIIITLMGCSVVNYAIDIAARIAVASL